MSDNLIKRSDAIEAIHNYWKKRLDTLPTKESEWGEVYADIQQVDKILEHNKTLCNFINAIPSADRPQGEWISCSERLPSEKDMYLVTSREKATAEEFGFDLDDVEVKKMRFDEDGWRIPKHIPEWINGVVHTTVLAWMPLPKPYGEREDE